MGLIKAALGAAQSVLSDQWKEYFYCDSISNEVLVVKGQKRKSGHSSNDGLDNIITNGSGIVVADGQCMIIVDNGKVVDYCAEPGQYTYDQSTEPSLFDGGNLADNVKAVFLNVGKRFTFGGEAPKDQRVYYFNIKENTGNKYGTPNPIPFRVVDERAGIDIDVSVRCFGEYSFRLTNPILFYGNVCGNVQTAYLKSQLESQMKTELLTALQPAFAKISESGIRYSQLPAHADDLAEVLNQVLSPKWKDLRGIEIVSCGVSSINATEEDEKMIKELQKSASFVDPARAAAYMVSSTGEAMKTAAGNTNGAVNAFMGMNMAGNAGGVSAQDLYAMAQQQGQAAQQAPVQPAAEAPVQPSTWKCECGNINTGNFCPNCGAKRPE